MQENHVSGLRVAALVVLALSAAAYVFVYARSVDKTYPTRTFSVEGSGEMETTPDVAQFSVTVMTEGGRDVTDTQKKNTEKMNKINAYLKEQGISEKDLKTTQYNLFPRYNPCFAGQCDTSIAGYSLTQTLQVKVRDTEKVGDLLTGVVASGANTVSDVSFVVDDPTAAKNEARKEAMSEAKKKAEDIARAGGFRLGKLVSLYETSDPAVPYAYGMGGDMAMSQNKIVAPAIEPGTQNTKVNMSLTYEILQ